MTTDGNAIFVDTNVLVYASVANAPLHAIAQQTLQNLPVLTLVADIEYFQNQFLVAEDSSQVTQNLLILVQQVAVAGKQIHDANIVATMQAHNISQLLTHNISDFNRFAHLINLLPL